METPLTLSSLHAKTVGWHPEKLQWYSFVADTRARRAAKTALARHRLDRVADLLYTLSMLRMFGLATSTDAFEVPDSSYVPVLAEEFFPPDN